MARHTTDCGHLSQVNTHQTKKRTEINPSPKSCSSGSSQHWNVLHTRTGLTGVVELQWIPAIGVR